MNCSSIVLCFVLGNQQVASNDCITDTTRYSVRRAGLLFCIGFESNRNRAPVSNQAYSVSSDSDSTSPSNPLTQARFSSFPAFTPEPSALFCFTTWMLLMEHPSFLAAHRLQFFCSTPG